MDRLKILIDGIEADKMTFAKRYEDYLVHRGLQPVIAFDMAKDFLAFLEGYEDNEKDI